MVELKRDADKAVEEKNCGNMHYRKKEFKEALECYERAINLDPANITFYTNKAAVYFEQGDHEKCRDECFTAVEIGRKHNSEANLIGKAFARIGNSFMKQKIFHEAKKYFLKALDENSTLIIKEKLKLCEIEIEEQQRQAYINPELAIIAKKLGDNDVAHGDYETSLEHYTEAIKRNPDDPAVYLSKAATLIKLDKPEEALALCQKCLAKDSNYVKGYICKGATLESLYRFDDAMEQYSKALDLDPTDKEAAKSYYRCLDRDYRRRNDAQSIWNRAVNDPKIGKLLPNSENSRTVRDFNAFQEKLLGQLSSLNPPDLKNLVKYGLMKIN